MTNTPHSAEAQQLIDESQRLIAAAQGALAEGDLAQARDLGQRAIENLLLANHENDLHAPS